MTDKAPHETVQLQREFGVLGGVAMVASTQIGSGIFMSPQNILKKMGSPVLSLAVWCIAGVFALLSLFCYLELSLLLKESGAEYSYLTHGYGKYMAFILMWAKLILIKPAAMACALVGFADYLLGSEWIGLSESNMDPDDYRRIKKIVAILSIVTITAVNSYSVKLVKRAQKFMFYTILVPVSFILVCGAKNLLKDGTVIQTETFNATDTVVIDNAYKPDIGAWCEAFYFAMWSYDGWQAMAYAVEEMKNPNKSLKYASVGGTILVTCLYLLMNVSYFTGLSPPEMLASKTVATDFVKMSLGASAHRWLWLVTLGVLFANFNTAMANAFTTGRLTFVAARNGNLPRFMSFVSVNQRTPSIALWSNCSLVVFVLCVVSTNFGTLVSYMAFTQWIFHGLSFAAVIILRMRMPDRERPFKVPLIFPIIMTTVSAILVLAPVVMKLIAASNQEPANKIKLTACMRHISSYGIAFSVLAVSVPVYFIVVPFMKRQPHIQRFYHWLSDVLQKLFMVTPENAQLETIQTEAPGGDSEELSSLTAPQEKSQLC